MESGCCLCVPLFLHFSFSNFQTLKVFVILFSRTVRPRRLKLGIHMDSGQMYLVYWNQAATANSSLYFFIFFLSNFQTLKFFVTLLSGTVRPRRLKLGIHVDSGWMYQVYQNQAAAAYLSLYFFNFLTLQFSNIKTFLSHFSQELRSRSLKLDTHVDSGQMYRLLESGCCLKRPFISSFFFLQFSNIKIFRHTLLTNCEA